MTLVATVALGSSTYAYVYVWFEGEDTHCMSDNLTAVLDTYDIDITCNCNDIGGAGAAASNP